MNNLSADIIKQIQEAIRRPEGTVEFTYTSEILFDPTSSGGILFEIISGAQYFRIERDKNLQLLFYHSSPGIGTRVAIINLNDVMPASKVYLAFSWSPTEINLNIAPCVEGGRLVQAIGVESPVGYRIAKGGLVVQIGDKGVAVSHYSMFVEGKSILQPTAIEVWRNTIQAVTILQGGTSEDGYIYENVISNLGISTLVTGYEVYCKTRLQELEQEGIKPDIETLILRFYSKKEIEDNEPEKLNIQAQEEGVTLLQKIAEKRINFQSYEESKRAFNKAYNIKFGEVGISSDQLDYLQRLMRYRHRIIHVSPLLGIMNQSEFPPEEPIFSNKNLLLKATQCFDSFINNLHEATLKLKRQD
jgi:hypothetical protein